MSEAVDESSDRSNVIEVVRIGRNSMGLRCVKV